MINDFENRKIKNDVCEPIEATRLVASYRNVAAPYCAADDTMFYEWLLSIGVSKEDAEWVVFYIVRNGKVELESNVDKFFRRKACKNKKK